MTSRVSWFFLLEHEQAPGAHQCLLGFALMAAYQRQKQGRQPGEKTEEFHFEVAAGGWEVHGCVCLGKKGELSFQRLDSAITTFQLISP